ncbi:MAG: O-antigen ligase family protein [Oscillospiraceae bacterium]
MSKYIKEKPKSSQNKLQAKYCLSSIFAIIVVVFAFSGYTARSSNYIMLGLFIIWFMIAFITDMNAFQKMVMTKTVLYYAAFLLFFLLTLMINTSTRDILKYVGANVILFSPIFIFLYYYRLEDNRYLKIITVAGLIAWGYFLMTAIRFYIQNEGAARELASDSTKFDDIAIGGGYGLAYASCILAVYLLDLILRNKFAKPIYKVLIAIAIVLLSVVVFETQSTITIIFLVSGLALDALLRIALPYKDNKKISLNSIIGMMLILALFIVVFCNLKNFGQIILDFSGGKSDIVSKRLYEVGSLLKYGTADNGSSGDLTGRIQLILTSFETFSDNFFFGIGYKYNYDFTEMFRVGVGSHSEWIDSLAKYGIMGGIPFLAAIISSVKLERKNSCVSFAYVLTTFFLGFFNPFITFQSTIALFLIIPGITAIYNDWKYDPVGNTKEQLEINRFD